MWNRILENAFRKADYIGGKMVGNRPSDIHKYKGDYCRERGKRRLVGLLLMVLLVLVDIWLIVRG